MSGEEPMLVAPCRYCARVGEWAGFDACSECVLVAKAARDERWGDMAVHMQEIVAAIRADERALVAAEQAERERRFSQMAMDSVRRIARESGEVNRGE